MNLQPFFIREQVIKFVRSFFEKRNFHEIIPSVLNYSVPAEPNIYPFTTKWDTCKGEKKFYLSTSPEKTIKQMIAREVGNSFSIGKSFRNLEDSGPLNNPEFLMLEWYRENAGYRMIMDETKELIIHVKDEIDGYLKKEKSDKLAFQGKEVALGRKWPVISIIDLFQNHAGLDLEKILNDSEMEKAVQKKGYNIENSSWEQQFNQIFLNEIEPNIGDDPLFIIDYPARISPLCAEKQNDPRFAERFELYLGGMELANGNTENTDSNEIRKKFQEEIELRKSRKAETSSLDEEFLSALDKMKGKSWSGVGLGIERLTMLLGDIKDLGIFSSLLSE
jgi:elongation factor P--(R)-beta-lysine ligase